MEPNLTHETKKHHPEKTPNHDLDDASSHQDPRRDHQLGTEYSSINRGEFKDQNTDMISDSSTESDKYRDLIVKVSKEGAVACAGLGSDVDKADWNILKNALKREIVSTSNQMFENYGGLDQFEYLPYNCKLHSEVRNSPQRGGDEAEAEAEAEEISPLDVIGEYSCRDCERSVLKNFLDDILATLDRHTNFPPTVQRICELLLFPNCYNNTKSFLYALDKLVSVSCPITIEDPNHSEAELSCSESNTTSGNKRSLTESANVPFKQDAEDNQVRAKRMKNESCLDI